MSYNPNVPAKIFYTSAYQGDLAKTCAAAESANAVVGISDPIVLTNQNITTSADIIDAGGSVKFAGTSVLTANSYAGTRPVFDVTSSSQATPLFLTRQTDWVSGIWFSPAFDGVTDCIKQWNAMATCVTAKGSKFEWPLGNYHTAFSNKFVLPTMQYMQFDGNGAAFDSTVVMQGILQTIKNFDVGCQVILNLTSVTGTFSVGEAISLTGSRQPANGSVAAWNAGTGKLTVNCFCVQLLGGSAVITGISSGATGTVSSVNSMIACALETGTIAPTTTDIKQILLDNVRTFGAQIGGHTIGVTGTNTDGSTPPTATAQTVMSCQNNIFQRVSGVGNTGNGQHWVGNGSSSFCNLNVNIAPVISANGGLGFYSTASTNYNSIIDADDEGNNILSGSSSMEFDGLDNKIWGGLLAGSNMATNSINNNSGGARLYAFGSRITAPPTGSQFYLIGRLSGFTGWNNLPAMDNGTFTELGVTGQSYLPLAGLSAIPSADVVLTVGAGGTTGHTAVFDLSSLLGAANTVRLCTVITAVNSGISSRMGIMTLFWSVQRDSNGNYSIQSIAPSPSQTTFTSFTVSTTTATLTFNSASSINALKQQTSYGDNNNTDLRT